MGLLRTSVLLPATLMTPEPPPSSHLTPFWPPSDARCPSDVPPMDPFWPHSSNVAAVVWRAGRGGARDCKDADDHRDGVPQQPGPARGLPERRPGLH
eukprot:7203494-Pyramimonas_sp.AAC.2